jgi:Xaa-Pro aminopeptidase
MAIRTYGPNAVDWEQRVDLDRLRNERLMRLRTTLDASELGGLLTFDFSNIRYMTSTHIGTWAVDKLIRYSLLVRGGEPIIWDFGSAARHHQLYNPWLDHSDAHAEDSVHGPHHGASPNGAARATGARAGISTLRGAFHPQAGIAEEVARKVKHELEAHGLLGEPLGVDVIELPILAAFQKAGIQVVDGQQVFLEARRVKTRDEIGLLTQAASMVDAAYDRLYEFLRPGVRENECVGLVSKVLYDLGSEYVEGVNAISGERCAPHPHVFSDRLIRPGDPAFFDILHSYMGYRTCYYRTFAVGSASVAQRDAYTRCREYMDQAIALVKPGATTADIVSVWPTAQEFGFADEEAAFALQYGHGVGLSIWEKPIFSRLVSLEHPEVIEEGMVFALETYWPAADGWSAARIEEELVVTADGCEVITKFPAEDLLVAGQRYFTVDGPLPTTRDSQSHLNTGTHA